MSDFPNFKATLRRDLDQLLPRGNIEKVYGGVIAICPKEAPIDSLISYSERNITNAETKAKIAQLATHTSTIMILYI